jgi:hypothetical protein
MRRQIIVTDVTEMQPGYFCIAGWNPAASRMLRPLLPGRHSWPVAWIGPDRFWPGSRVEFRLAPHQPKGEWPHATEDVSVIPESILFPGEAAGPGWTRGLRVNLSPSLARAFGRAVQYLPRFGIRTRTAVASGTAVPSLGAVLVRPGDLHFREGPLKGAERQLRARLTDADGRYDLPVVAHQLRKWRREGGLAMVEREIGPGPWHVRLGLARPFGGGEACFVMVNGVYPL